MSHKRTILVIEDENHIRIAFQLTLESEGYDVVLAANGKVGLELLRKMEAPCAVVTDLKMPEMDGYEFLKEKNNDPTIAFIPVIVVSATPDQSRLVGVAEVIRKPFDMSLLLAAVARFGLK